MSNQVSDTLQDAFQLIEDNKLNEARTLLEPLLESEPDNPTVWWIYAHAVEDSDEGIRAVHKVLELDPTYPGASELKSEISQTSAPIDDFDDLEFEEELPSPKPEVSSNRGGIPRLAIVAVILLVVIIGLFLLLTSGSNTSDVDPTEVADTTAPTIDAQIIDNVTATAEEIQPTITVAVTDDTDTPVVESTETDEPDPTNTTEPDPTETDEPDPTDTSEPEPTETDEPESTALLDALSDLGVTEDDIAIQTTAIGETLIVTVCSALGPQSSVTLNTAMSSFVEQEASLPVDADAVAVALVDCDDENSATRIIGVERTVVQSLADDEIELKDFQRAWQPLQVLN